MPPALDGAAPSDGLRVSIGEERNTFAAEGADAAGGNTDERNRQDINGAHARRVAIEAVSRRLIDQARDYADAYVNEYDGVRAELDTHNAIVLEFKRTAAQERKKKKAETRKKIKGANPFIHNPQDSWMATNAPMGSTDHTKAGLLRMKAGSIYGEPVLPPIKRVPWVSAQSKDADEDQSPLGAFKTALARNLTRVTELFRKWDVNLDGRIDLDELRCAVGALGLTRNSDWDEESVQLLMKQLDKDSSGSVEFNELYKMLRKFKPPDLASLKRAQLLRGSSLISHMPPVRRDPKEEDPSRPNPAVEKLMKVLTTNQARVIDMFRKWDFDSDSSVSCQELKRALSALCIPIDTKAIEQLFRWIDKDSSGSISFEELNQVLRRKVGFSKGLERFDAETGKYLPGFTNVKQLVCDDDKLPPLTSGSRLVGSASLPANVSRVVPEDALAAARFAEDQGKISKMQMKSAAELGSRQRAGLQ